MSTTNSSAGILRVARFWCPVAVAFLVVFSCRLNDLMPQAIIQKNVNLDSVKSLHGKISG